MYDLQKANMWKRISAALFDFIILCMAAVGFAALLSAMLGYDGYTSQMQEYYAAYEEKYDISLDLTVNEYNALSDEEKAKYEEADKAFAVDPEVNKLYGMIFNLTLLIIIFGILTAFILLEFIVPLIFKNGQTLGKKIFGIGVMRADGVKITPVLLFARTVLGKYTVETMLPVMIALLIYFNVMGIIGTVVIFAIALVQLIMVFATHAHYAIHDKLAYTVTVDIASQMIFDTEEQLLEYKKQKHLENTMQS